LIIKPAYKQDAALLAKLGATTFYDAFAKNNKPEDMEQYISTRFTTEQLEAEFDHPGARFYLAYVNDEVAGYAKLGTNPPDVPIDGRRCMELERLYLLEKFHGQKLGQRLLQFCIDTAVELGYNTLWLGVWEQNPKAISLYTKMGFRRFGSHIFRLGNDAQTDTLMRLDL
jgi:diamine N-acetyltransferase